jgi:hypothetical protein
MALLLKRRERGERERERERERRRAPCLHLAMWLISDAKTQAPPTASNPIRNPPIPANSSAYLNNGEEAVLGAVVVEAAAAAVTFSVVTQFTATAGKKVTQFTIRK